MKYLHGHTHTAQPHTHLTRHTHTLPKRDPRKQEMIAEGRACSRERTDTSRPLSERREEEEGGRPVEQQETTGQH